MLNYKDIADKKEDDRISEIGETVMVQRKVVGFLTDQDIGKADRYIAKLQERFPGIRIISRGTGPVSGVVWVKVGPPLG